MQQFGPPRLLRKHEKLGSLGSEAKGEPVSRVVWIMKECFSRRVLEEIRSICVDFNLSLVPGVLAFILKNETGVLNQLDAILIFLSRNYNQLLSTKIIIC